MTKWRVPFGQMIWLFPIFSLVFATDLSLSSESLPAGNYLVTSPREFKRLSIASTPRPAGETSAKLKRQAHLKIADKSVVIEDEKPAEPLSVWTVDGFTKHEFLTTKSSYDPNELFRDFNMIATNGKVKFLVDPHSPMVFSGLEFAHWKVLFRYLGNSAGLSNFEGNRAISLLKNITSEDITMIAKNVDGCYLLGLVFRFIPKDAMVKAKIPVKNSLDMFCMLSSPPNSCPNQYDLEYLISNRYPRRWLEKFRGPIQFKLDYRIDFSSPLPRLVERDSRLVEKFFIDSGVIEKGRSPFTENSFKLHSPNLLNGINSSRLKSLLRWANESKSTSVLRHLTRSDLCSMTDTDEKCGMLAPVISDLDLYNLPINLSKDSVLSLISDVSWNHQKPHANDVLHALNPVWKEKYKNQLVPVMTDHYPRSRKMKAGVLMAENMSQTEVEDYFLETGVILDGLKPFTPETFPFRSRGLLLKASRFAIVNFARWVGLGSLDRAASLVETLSADELVYFERKKILHVFAEVFPLMNMESVVKASLMISTMKVLLGKIGEPDGKYKFTWKIVDTFPVAFLSDHNYAGALIDVVCTKLHFDHLTQDTLDRMHKIHGKGCPPRHAWWVALSREVIMEEVEGRVFSMTSEISRLLEGVSSEARKEVQETIDSKVAKIESLKEAFIDACFELELAPLSLHSERFNELRQDLYCLRSAVDELTSAYSFLVKHPLIN